MKFEISDHFENTRTESLSAANPTDPATIELRRMELALKKGWRSTAEKSFRSLKSTHNIDPVQIAQESESKLAEEVEELESRV